MTLLNQVSGYVFGLEPPLNSYSYQILWSDEVCVFFGDLLQNSLNVFREIALSLPLLGLRILFPYGNYLILL